ncbi:MAG: hypothetical protein ACRDRI_24315 [Pseudonocardiaceae bacterium]
MSGEDGARPGPLPGMPGAQATSAPAEGSPGQPVLPQPTTTTGSGGFSVDLERAPQAIVDLRAAAKALWHEADRAWDLALITPPGLDGVSADAVQLLADAASASRVHCDWRWRVRRLDSRVMRTSWRRASRPIGRLTRSASLNPRI